ncbi:hypothetical protein RFI_14092 [Reticulomyxa filosa]|uniref:Uncharacterized protein n=1 Tax=Reticulomyxa filosa TaxID=46433 RepID=X6NB07_RETFI|nr:hypothetical protein RFI_14092 [Reticulomyxa filosa]|eukprot:ETO23093.1 hypothetical protein RFI_14092 [Reticulomyxa filosa]
MSCKHLKMSRQSTTIFCQLWSVILCLVVLVQTINIFFVPSQGVTTIPKLVFVIPYTNDTSKSLGQLFFSNFKLYSYSLNVSKNSLNMSLAPSQASSEIAKDNNESKKARNLKTYNDLFKSPDGIIYGNPLTYPECANALMNAYERIGKIPPKSEILAHFDDFYKKNQLRDRGKKKPTNIPPELWTKEALSAMMDEQGYHNLYLHTGFKGTFDPLYSSNSTNPKAAYLQIGKAIFFYFFPCFSLSLSLDKQLFFYSFFFLNLHSKGKCATSSVVSMLNMHNNKPGKEWFAKSFHINRFSRITSIKYEADCSFTFVRDPLSRLVSAYYTINLFLWRNKMELARGNTRGAGL